MKVNKYIQFSLIGLVIKFLSNSNVYIKAGVKISIVIQCFRMDQLKSIIPGKKNNKPNKMPNAQATKYFFKLLAPINQVPIKYLL